MALIVDEYGDIQGLLTMADLLGEIVGEIATDPIPHAHNIQQAEDGSWKFSGNINIRELEHITNYNFNTDADGPVTLNGLILEQLESIPQSGTTLLINNYPVEVLQTHDNKVKLASIKPAIPTNESTDS